MKKMLLILILMFVLPAFCENESFSCSPVEPDEVEVMEPLPDIVNNTAKEDLNEADDNIPETKTGVTIDLEQE